MSRHTGTCSGKRKERTDGPFRTTRCILVYRQQAPGVHIVSRVLRNLGRWKSKGRTPFQALLFLYCPVFTTLAALDVTAAYKALWRTEPFQRFFSKGFRAQHSRVSFLVSSTPHFDPFTGGQRNPNRDHNKRTNPPQHVAMDGHKTLKVSS